MHLRFTSSLISAVALAGASDGWPKAEGEPGSGKTPARLRRAILQGARRARKEDGMVGILERDGDDGADAFPLKANRDPRVLAAATAPTCEVNGIETDFVECTGDGAECKQKCLDACAGVDDCSCCVGGIHYGYNGYIYSQACNGFQGKVCPDGSCSSPRSCTRAKIDYVVDGCQGNWACDSAGENGHLGSVVSSCNAYDACFFAARDGGYIKGISSSCNAFKACHYAAYNGGSIQEISSSCNENLACAYAAIAVTIQNKIERCCNSVSACRDLAQDPGCPSVSACEELRQDPGPDQCDAAPMPSPSTASPTTGSTTIKNAGKGCWAHCGETAGDCPYCGTGQCCRAVDYRNQVPGCELAENAQGARCGAWRGGGFPSLMNARLPCMGKCGKQPGDCDYCGTAGQCCRPFDGERCVPGCELASEDSWMGPGSQCGEFKDPSAAPVHCAPTP